MPTFIGSSRNNQLLFASTVSDPAKLRSNNYYSLLDTGAQMTLISQKVVSGSGLISIGPGFVVPANGQPVVVPRYRARVEIPVTEGKQTLLRGADMDVLQLPYQPSNYDVLLGMDFISIFHLTLYGGQFIISI